VNISVVSFPSKRPCCYQYRTMPCPCPLPPPSPLQLAILQLAWTTEYTECWPVRFLMFCSISIFLLASLVAGRRPQCTLAGNLLYHTYPLEYQIFFNESCWASSLRIWPALYVFGLLCLDSCRVVVDILMRV
jgi:hypothetical protein